MKEQYATGVESIGNGYSFNTKKEVTHMASKKKSAKSGNKGKAIKALPTYLTLQQDGDGHVMVRSTEDAGAAANGVAEQLMAALVDKDGDTELGVAIAGHDGARNLIELATKAIAGINGERTFYADDAEQNFEAKKASKAIADKTISELREAVRLAENSAHSADNSSSAADRKVSDLEKRLEKAGRVADQGVALVSALRSTLRLAPKADPMAAVARLKSAQDEFATEKGQLNRLLKDVEGESILDKVRALAAATPSEAALPEGAVILSVEELASLRSSTGAVASGRGSLSGATLEKAAVSTLLRHLDSGVGVLIVQSQHTRLGDVLRSVVHVAGSASEDTRLLAENDRAGLVELFGAEILEAGGDVDLKAAARGFTRLLSTVRSVRSENVEMQDKVKELDDLEARLADLDGPSNRSVALLKSTEMEEGADGRWSIVGGVVAGLIGPKDGVRYLHDLRLEYPVAVRYLLHKGVKTPSSKVVRAVRKDGADFILEVWTGLERSTQEIRISTVNGGELLSIQEHLGIALPPKVDDETTLDQALDNGLSIAVRGETWRGDKVVTWNDQQVRLTSAPLLTEIGTRIRAAANRAASELMG